MEVAEDEICQIAENLWSSVLGLELRRGGRVTEAEERESAPLGCIHISGAWEGSVALQTTPGLIRRATSILLGVEPETATSEDLKDILAELTNIIGGNIKGLLPEPSKLSLPALLDRREFARMAQAGSVKEVGFDCDGERFWITVLQKEEPGRRQER